MRYLFLKIPAIDSKSELQVHRALFAGAAQKAYKGQQDEAVRLINLATYWAHFVYSKSYIAIATRFLENEAGHVEGNLVLEKAQLNREAVWLAAESLLASIS